MGILGINNRTENWKTVQHFHGLSDAAKVRLVRRLGEPDDTVAEEIGLELFWTGMRDYVKEHKVKTDDLAGVYGQLFGELRDELAKFKHTHDFKELKDHNYAVPTCPKHRENLANNVRHTEVDIVMETPERIFIGEAKYESGFKPDSGHVLVHQLIRQYVIARMIVHLAGRPGKQVVAFVVTGQERVESVKNSAQVEFMSASPRRWLPKSNILSWGQVNDIRISCS